MTSTLDLELRHEPDVDLDAAPPVVLEVEDCSDPLRVLELLDAALQTHPRELLVDLSRCRTFDADTVRVLLDVHCEAVRDGAGLVLRQPSEAVLQAISASGLQGVFAVRADQVGQDVRSAA